MTYRSPRIEFVAMSALILESGTGRDARLAEEMLDRGWHVEFCADSDSVPPAGERLAEIGCDVRPGFTSIGFYMAWVEESALTASVFDSYLLDPDISRAVTTAIPTLTFIDGSTRGQSASVYVDQNYGAERAAWPIGGTSGPRRPSARWQFVCRTRGPGKAPETNPTTTLGGNSATDCCGCARQHRCVAVHRNGGGSYQVTAAAVKY